MKPNDFIINKINEIVEAIPDIKCSYEFDNFDKIHIIKIEPEIFLEITEDYLFKDNGILDEVTEKYPNERLAIITNDDIFDIKNSTYFKEGSEFNKPKYDFSDFLLLNKELIFNNKLNNSKIDEDLSSFIKNLNLDNIGLPRSITSNLNSSNIEGNSIINNDNKSEFSTEEDFKLAA